MRLGEQLFLGRTGSPHYTHRCNEGKSLSCPGRVKVFIAVLVQQQDFQVLAPQTTHSALYDVSIAYWQEPILDVHLGYGLGREKQERKRERDFSG